MTGDLPVEGWYDNPEGDGLRYWDGEQWTDRYRDEEWNPQRRIKELADALPTKLGLRKELQTLPSYLNKGETVEHLASGTYNGKSGLLVATDKRVLFLTAGITGSQFEDIPFSKISSVQQSSGLVLASITVHASGTKAEVSHLNKAQAKALAEFVRSRTGAQVQSQTTKQPQDKEGRAERPPERDLAQQIRDLGALRDEGLLTEEEFEAKKKDLLGL